MGKLFDIWVEFMAVLMVIALLIGTVIGGSLIWLIWALIQHFTK